MELHKGRAVHQQQEAAVLVLRKYHKAEIFTYVADTWCSVLITVAWAGDQDVAHIRSLPSGIKVRKQNTNFGKRG